MPKSCIFSNVVQRMLTNAPPICERLSILLTIFTLVAIVYTADHDENLLDRVGKLRMLSERSVKESSCQCWGFQGCEEESPSINQLLSHYSSIAHETHLGFTTGINDVGPFLLEFHKLYEERVPPNSTRLNSTELLQYCEIGYFELDEVAQKFISTVNKINHNICNEISLRRYGTVAFLAILLLIMYRVGLVGRKLLLRLKSLQSEKDAKSLTINQVCHEIRGHLSAVKIALEASSEYALVHGNVRLVDAVRTGLLSTVAQEDVLQNRLAMFNLMNGRCVAKSEPVELVALSTCIFDRYRVSDSEVVTSVGCLFSELWLSTDSYLVERALSNLVSNAMKYTTSGSITIHVEAKTNGQGISSPSRHRASVCPEIDAGVSVSEIEVRVRDTGSGIGIARQVSLFDRTSTIEDRRGSGLGLPFAELIMLTLGGKIRLERSAEGVGSVFLLNFPGVGTGVGTGRTTPPCPGEIVRGTEPVSSSLPSALPGVGVGTTRKETGSGTTPPRPGEIVRDTEPVSSSLPSALPSGLLILLVDDQKFVRKMMRFRFETLGAGLRWRVLEAETGEKSLSMIPAHEVDIITMDENMEAAGGLLKGTETIVKLRDRGFNGLIVGCSGDEDIKVAHLGAGADISWGKPLPSEVCMRTELGAALMGLKRGGAGD